MKLSDLISTNYISNIKDPKDNSVCDNNNSVIKVENIGSNQYRYETFLQCTNYKSKDIAGPDISYTVAGNNITASANEYDLNINNNTLDIGRALIPATDNWEIEMNINVSSVGTANGLFEQYGSGQNGRLLFRIEGSGRLLLFIGSSLGDVNLMPVAALSINTWYNIKVGRRNANIFYVNINGVETTVTSTTPIYTGANTKVFTAAGAPYIGKSKSIKIKDGTLTNLASYNFQDYSGNIIYDGTTNKYNATLSGTISANTFLGNSGVRAIKIDNGAWDYVSAKTFSGLSSGGHTITAEDNLGNSTTTGTITIP
jgi:hypothetical protein